MDIRNQIVGGSAWVFENEMGMSVEQVSERKGGGWSVWSHSLATETHPPRFWPPASVGGSLDASSSCPTLISLTHTQTVVTPTLET